MSSFCNEKDVHSNRDITCVLCGVKCRTQDNVVIFKERMEMKGKTGKCKEDLTLIHA